MSQTEELSLQAQLHSLEVSRDSWMKDVESDREVLKYDLGLTLGSFALTGAGAGFLCTGELAGGALIILGSVSSGLFLRDTWHSIAQYARSVACVAQRQQAIEGLTNQQPVADSTN